MPARETRSRNLPGPSHNRHSILDGCAVDFVRQLVLFAGRSAIFVAILAVPAMRLASQQVGAPVPAPDSPQPQPGATHAAEPPPCPAKSSNVGSTPTASAGGSGVASPAEPSATPSSSSLRGTTSPCLPPPPNWYVRFTNGPQVKPLTPREKAWLATRNVVDPFNVITILGDSAIAVGSNSDSPYGPGMPGFARNVGVSFTQDMTGEFFNTFLIPSIMRQDPHYHRMPNARIPRRIGHAILQVVWTQGDNGRGMPNYGNLVGSMIDDEISNLYVPGRQTNLPASAERYGIALATAPVDNFVSEFLPDVANHIHVQVVVIQRIINQVAKTNDGPL
jgi:hypothetical protein